MKVFNKNKGFTLIELLVVVSIIGLLSSVIFSSLSSARSKVRDARTLEDVHQITLALQLAHDLSSNNAWPGVYGDWQCLKSNGLCFANTYHGNTTITTALAPYMPNIPKVQAPSSSWVYDSYLFFPDLSDNPGYKDGAYLFFAMEHDFPNQCSGVYGGYW